MSELAPETEAYAAYLAGLPSDAMRQAAEQQKRMLVMAELPDEEVGKPPVTALGDYLDNEIQLPPMLVEPGLVARGAISAMISRGGKGKTALSLNRLIRWSMGEPVFDELPDLMKPVGPLKVLLIENEGAPGHFQKVLSTILTRNEFTTAQIDMARENVHIWGDGGWSGLKVDDEKDLAMIDRAAGTTEADIIFIEPFRGLWKGEENSSTDMANVLDSLSGLANDHNAAVLITHHERKSGVEGNEDAMSAARGSGVLEAAAAVMERWKPVKAERQRELSWIKNRFEERPAEVRMEFERESWSYRLVQEDEAERDVLKMLGQFPDQYISLSEMSEDLDENYAKIRRVCQKLREDDRIREKRMDGKLVYAHKGDNGNDAESLAIT